MSDKRPEKKSETLEVRLPHSKKEAFMEACERVAWEDFDAEGLGLVIVDNPPDETDAPNPPR